MAFPLVHPTSTPATEAVLNLLAATPASGVMPRSAVVQDSAGTVKVAANEVADPVVTAAWYPAKVCERVAAAVIRSIAWWLSHSAPPGPAAALRAGRAMARAGAAMLAARPTAAAAAVPVMMVRVLVSTVVLLWW